MCSLETLGEIVGSGAAGLARLALLEGGFLDAVRELSGIGGRVQRKLNRFVHPGRVEDGVGEFHGMNAFDSWRNEFFAVKDGVGEILQDLEVLPCGTFDGDGGFPGFGLAEGGTCFITELAHRHTIAAEPDGAVLDGDETLLADDL